MTNPVGTKPPTPTSIHVDINERPIEPRGGTLGGLLVPDQDIYFDGQYRTDDFARGAWQNAKEASRDLVNMISDLGNCAFGFGEVVVGAVEAVVPGGETGDRALAGAERVGRAALFTLRDGPSAVKNLADAVLEGFLTLPIGVPVDLYTITARSFGQQKSALDEYTTDGKIDAVAPSLREQISAPNE